MKTVLLILGFLGIGAILISAYVFTVAARNYVSDGRSPSVTWLKEEDYGRYDARSNQERRQHTGKYGFPLALASREVIEHDRRHVKNRRAASA